VQSQDGLQLGRSQSLGDLSDLGKSGVSGGQDGDTLQAVDSLVNTSSDQSVNESLQTGSGGGGGGISGGDEDGVDVVDDTLTLKDGVGGDNGGSVQTVGDLDGTVGVTVEKARMESLLFLVCHAQNGRENRSSHHNQRC
jgi:hypothetical protein